MHNAIFFLKYKLHHLVFWMLIFGLWYFFRYQDFPNGQKAFLVTFIKVADLALMVYFTNYFLIPRLLYKKKYFWFGLAFVSMILISSAVKMNLLGRLLDNPLLLNISGNLKERVYDNVLPHFFLVTAGAAFKLVTDYTKMQQRMVEMAKEKAEAELSFLKSQINPHFLFNSLNTVYFMIDKNNNEARGALHKFSDMLRYQLYEMNGDRIAVEKEISYLQDYVDLQKLRTDDKYTVTFNCNKAVAGFLIEPLLLIPFVENAFKHISHHTGNINFVKVDLNFGNNQFHFEVENSKENKARTNAEQGGIGLVNVQRRLALLYPGKHQLEINDETDKYRVDLKINIE